MEVTGEQNLLTSFARALFAITKTWIVEHWEKEGRSVSKIEIRRKTIGRNPGFIVCATISGDSKDVVRYYAKYQELEIETVMMHYLLKYTGCGPKDFLLTILPEHNFEHNFNCMQLGIVTREVADFIMTSSWSSGERMLMRENPIRIHRFSFLLAFFTKFGRFGNIPSNKDNWGLARHAKEGFPMLQLVDFSSYGQDESMEQRDFRSTWCTARNKVLKSVYPDGCIPDDAYQLCEYNEILGSCAWLRSHGRFVKVMQRVVSCTDAWILKNCTNAETSTGTCTDLEASTSRIVTGRATKVMTMSAKTHLQETVAFFRDNVQADNTVNITAESVRDTVNFLKDRFWDHWDDCTRVTLNTTFLTTSVLKAQYTPSLQPLFVEYETWLKRWNKQMNQFIGWFPNPGVFLEILARVKHNGWKVTVEKREPCDCENTGVAGSAGVGGVGGVSGGGTMDVGHKEGPGAGVCVSGVSAGNTGTCGDSVGGGGDSNSEAHISGSDADVSGAVEMSEMEVVVDGASSAIGANQSTTLTVPDARVSAVPVVPVVVPVVPIVTVVRMVPRVPSLTQVPLATNSQNSAVYSSPARTSHSRVSTDNTPAPVLDAPVPVPAERVRRVRTVRTVHPVCRKTRRGCVLKQRHEMVLRNSKRRKARGY